MSDDDNRSELMYLSRGSVGERSPDGRLVMLPKTRAAKQQTPQEAIDEFWSKFTTKTPGRATTVVPQNNLTDRIARKKAKAKTTSTTTQASYDEAAAMCRAKVDKIVKECRRINKKYRDPHFDLEADLKLERRDCLESLSNIKDAKPPGFEFKPQSAKRVVDIFDKPQFYIDGPSSNDVRQGRDGDCWLMAALCTLSNKPSLVERLCVAHDQDVGVYGFVFYRDGEWISEIVDDFLYLTKADYDEGYLDRLLFDELERINPEEAYRRIYQANSSALYFAQCQNPQETWLPLLEKCFAKAHGDYAAIEGGFGGEGLEDLTGGVTSELFTADILDKEYFWKEELLKVNQEFLFGCSTGVWGAGWGERKGIVELHAYSIQKAIEIDGKRLLRLKNPWGKGEWKGAWSDGSKEWTPEWLEKLGHRFGDDGDFWISYEDLLRKYQAFERTRLFSEEWRVSQLWTTLTIPWALNYHDTYFSFNLSKPGSVVIVLAQLDDRYYRGLEGQYRFELAFRLHKSGQEDYLVRSQAPYRMRRSVNVELELEAGDYDVMVRVDANRYEGLIPVEEVIRNNVKRRREKLTRIGLAYDLAHGKGKIVETEEEKQAREAYEKKIKDKERREAKKRILQSREEAYYLKTKKLQRERKKRARRIEKQQAKREARAAARREAKAANGQANGEAESAHGPKIVDENSAEGSESQQEKEAAKKAEEAEDEPSKKQAEESKTSEAHADPKDHSTNGNSHQIESTSDEDLTATAPLDELGKASAANGKMQPTAKPDIRIDFPRVPVPRHGPRFHYESEDGFGLSDDELSLDSLSELSDRELDIQIEDYRAQTRRPPIIPRPPPSIADEAPLDDFEKDPWNAVAVVGLRVYYKAADGSADESMVKLKVVRPSPYSDDEDEDSEEVDKKEKSKGLDVDDSAKDATLEGGVKDRKKSIMGDQLKRS